MSWCDKKPNFGLHNAILFVQDIPTAACVSGNGFVWSLQDNVEKTRNLIRSICKGKVVMEKRKLNYHKGRDAKQAKRVDTLAPKGKEPGYIGSPYDITNELSVPGLKIAPKMTILSSISELVNPYALLLRGRDFARRNDGADGRGGSKKRKPGCNDLDKSSTFAQTWKGADLLLVFHGKERRYTCECTKFNDANKRETYRQRPETSIEFH